MGALFLFGKNRRIPILAPDMSKYKAPVSVHLRIYLYNQRKDGVTRLEEAHAWTLCSGQTVCTVKLKTHAPQNNVM